MPSRPAEFSSSSAPFFARHLTPSAAGFVQRRRHRRHHFKGWISLALYVAAIPLAFVEPMLACGIYVLVAAIWLLPDRRFEKLVSEKA